MKIVLKKKKLQVMNVKSPSDQHQEEEATFIFLGLKILILLKTNCTKILRN